MESSRPDLNAASEHQQSMQHDYDTNSPPNSRLFVVCSKLFSEDDIREIFSPHGSIQDVYIIRDKTPARASKGVCFIKFFKSSEACRAMEELNGKHVRDSERPIKVLMAQSRSNERSYPSGGSQSQGFTGTRGSNFSEDEQIDNLLRLFVAVDKKQSQEEVKEYFSKFGLVDHVHILKDKETGDSRGVAYVKFYRASHAAIALEEASPEYKAILADPRPPKGGPVINHNSSGAHTAPGFHYNSGGASYTTATYAPSAVYGGSKGAPGTDSTGVGVQNLHHSNPGYGTLANSGQQPAITPLFPPPPPPHAGTHPHAALGNAPAPALTAMFQMAACGDDGAPWIGAPPTNPATAGPLHPQTIPTFEHINMACRTLGFNSCRIQAFVNSSQTTENQIRCIFDLVPGLENFFYSGSDQQRGGQGKTPSAGSPGIVYATYSTPFAALYAREKLNGLEYPPGFRITAKLLEDTCAYPPPAGTGPPNRGFGAASNTASVPTTAQILNMQMTRAMAMGLGGNNLNAGINSMTITTNGPAMKASNVSSKVALNSTAPMPTMGTGDSPQQDVELINADGVRGYLFPSGGGNPVCVSQESYPSFTSSSSGGSNAAVVVNTGTISTHGKSASLPNSGSGEGGQPSRNKKRGGGGANSSSTGGHNRRNSATGVSNKSSNAVPANTPNAAVVGVGVTSGVTGTAGATAVVVNQRNFTTSASSQATQAALPNGMTNGTY